MSPVVGKLLFTLVFVTITVAKYQLIKVEVKTEIDGVTMKRFTKEEMAKHDASDPDLPIYLGFKGVVFDVTKGKHFYGKESEYNKLVGKDASRAHALWSLDEKDMIHDLSGLNDNQLEGLDEVYKGTYLAKYPIVGYMDYLIDQQSPEIRDKFGGKDEL
ncbi:hypothetical protein ACF0H5_002181 [Mactra antiquata]